MSVSSIGLVRGVSSSLLPSRWWRHGWLSDEERASVLVQTPWSQTGMMLSSSIYHLSGLVMVQVCTCTKKCFFYIYEQISINDSFILESCVYKILKRYLGREKYYSQLVDLFIETTRQTELGQLLDLTSQPLVGAIDLNRFTLERYRWSKDKIALCQEHTVTWY